MFLFIYLFNGIDARTNHEPLDESAKVGNGEAGMQDRSRWWASWRRF